MCGIFAIFLKRPIEDRDIALGRAGTVALRHRGPDGSGEWIDRNAGVYLGHRRLAILDLHTRSNQPLRRHRQVICYNGELYNFRDLRRNLEASGEQFVTTGDTEVVAAALDFWGEVALDHFDGMFAFVNWDGKKGLIAVDLFGEKPLFFAEMEDGVYISSEIAPLAKLLKLRPNFTENTRAAYFALGRLPAPDTIYREVKKLPPASLAWIENGHIQSRRRYWTAPVGEPGRSKVSPLSKHELDRLAGALITSLKNRLHADVPVSLFLSAGIDSTLVAALCSRELKTSPKAITISFPRGSQVDEAPAARKIARELGLEHIEVKSHEDPKKVGPDTLNDLLGQPSDLISALSIQQISRSASQSHKVALTGVGGDEISMGYGKYVFAWEKRGILDSPSWLRALIGQTLQPFGPLIGRARNFGRQYAKAPSERYLAIKNYPAIDLLRLLPGFVDWAEENFPESQMPFYQTMSNYDMNFGLADEQLYACDIAGMRESVELRTPFLNRKVTETIAGFDPRALVAFGQKSVLRALLNRYVPNTLIDFPKAGLIYPPEIFLANTRDNSPYLPGVPRIISSKVWQNRFNGGGMARLAIRMIVADAFFTKQADAFNLD